MTDNLLNVSPGDEVGLGLPPPQTIPPSIAAMLEHQRRWAMPSAQAQLPRILQAANLPWNIAMAGPKFAADLASGAIPEGEQGGRAMMAMLGYLGLGLPGAARGAVGALGGKGAAKIPDEAWADFVASHKLAAKTGEKPSSVTKIAAKEPMDYSGQLDNSTLNALKSVPPIAIHQQPNKGATKPQVKLTPDEEQAFAHAAETTRESFRSLLPGDPLERARQLGFTTDVYHGAKSKFIGPELNIPPGYGFYASTAPELADMYAGIRGEYAKNRSWMPQTSEQGSAMSRYFGQSGESVLPLRINPSEYHEVDAGGLNWATHSGDESGALVMNKALKYAKENGKKGVIVRNIYDEPLGDTRELGAPKDVYIPLDPTTVRSRFANFDPSKIHLNDLLASMGGVAVASGLAHDVVQGHGDRLRALVPMPEGFEP